MATYASVGAAIKGAAKELRDELAGAGVPASVSPGALNPPGAWVRPRTLAAETVGGGYAVRCDVFLIVADTDHLEAVDRLAKLLDQALTVVEPEEGVNLYTSVALRPGSTPLPAFHLVVDQLVDVEE